MLKVFRRFVIISFVSAILTVAVFVSFNTPKVVKADVIAGVALGAGCLAALLASSFAVAGVQITNSGGSESFIEGWYNDIVNTYKQADADHKAIVETYFDDQGRYIGSEDDLQFVLSDQAYGYWQMGKGVNALMEDIKSWFVTENSLSSTSSVLYQGQGTNINGISYPVYFVNSGQVFNIDSISSVLPVQDGTYIFNIGDNIELKVVLQLSIPYPNMNTVDVNARFYINDVDRGGQTSNIGISKLSNLKFIFCVPTYGTYQNYFTLAMLSRVSNNSSDSTIYKYFTDSAVKVNNDTIILDNISVEGSLTDGYQDYQDALNQDLANEQDNEKAVVQVGVGELPGVLTGEQVVADLLEQATAGTLEGTYEGVYESQQEATEDKEGEKEFVSEVPEGWVVVNGLEDFFPFCIPYDFYNLVVFFDATPEAPLFEFDIELGGVLGTHHVELDFSTFDTVARIFRITVIIGFIVFLILATRSRFIRG